MRILMSLSHMYLVICICAQNLNLVSQYRQTVLLLKPTLHLFSRCHLLLMIQEHCSSSFLLCSAFPSLPDFSLYRQAVVSPILKTATTKHYHINSVNSTSRSTLPLYQYFLKFSAPPVLLFEPTLFRFLFPQETSYQGYQRLLCC